MSNYSGRQPKRRRTRAKAPIKRMYPPAAAPHRQSVDTRWFTVGMVAAPAFLIGVLGMIAVIGLLMANPNGIGFVATPLPPTPTPYVPPYAISLRLYDPIRDELVTWDVPPTVWGQWIAIPISEAPLPGTALPLDSAQVETYLTERQAELDSDRYINLQEGVAAAVNAAAGSDDTPIRLYHHQSQHIVQPGESIISIAWDNGFPYPYVQEVNPGVDALSVGQSITLPSPDVLLPLPVVAGKRIEVSISEQRARVYENGALKWDWVISTGIDSSPTWTGVYQILSHEPNAYASNWNLYMPNFLGVYRPVAYADFTNGFHGFPTRGGSQLLWTNSLGTRVTYGCILLSNDNIALLYAWAEDGVVVEITG